MILSRGYILSHVLTASPIPITPTLSVAAEPSVSNLTTQARVGAGVLGEPSLSSQNQLPTPSGASSD